MNRYMAFHLGCSECEEESEVIGFYTFREQAEAAARHAYSVSPLRGLACQQWVVFDVHGKVGFAEFQDATS